MLRSALTFSVLSAAVLSSIATSAPRWSVGATDSERVHVDRGDALELGIELFANGDALPEVEGGFAPQGGPPAEGGLASELSVKLEIESKGFLGFNREDTTVTAELWMDTDEGDWLVDELEVDVLGGEPVEVELFADGVFSSCETGIDCHRSLTVVLDQTGDAKLSVKVRTRTLLVAPLPGPAPDSAFVDVEVREF